MHFGNREYLGRLPKKRRERGPRTHAEMRKRRGGASLIRWKEAQPPLWRVAGGEKREKFWEKRGKDTSKRRKRKLPNSLQSSQQEKGERGRGTSKKGKNPEVGKPE